ncbi:MAG: leucine-rich repeat domain-containing protein [Tannerellaceae bacterium]|jgi:hypothetical protein|nr:leucine-rich repeat domain-containing protein [Tannerellaceae bacterium]
MPDYAYNGPWYDHRADIETVLLVGGGVTSIGNRAFSYCDALTEIAIPASVTSIDYYAFERCDALASVTCLAPTPPTLLGSDNFNANTADVLHVPAGSLAAYQGSAWKAAFSSIVEIP